MTLTQMTLLSRNVLLALERRIRDRGGSNARKGVVVAAAVVVVSLLIGLYVAFLTNGPTPYRPRCGERPRRVNLTLQTVAAVGPKLSPNENWVSYLVRENGVGAAAPSGRCPRTRSCT